MINYTTKQLERLYEANKCIIGDDSMMDILEAKRDRLQEIKGKQLNMPKEKTGAWLIH